MKIAIEQIDLPPIELAKEGFGQMAELEAKGPKRIDMLSPAGPVIAAYLDMIEESECYDNQTHDQCEAGKTAQSALPESGPACCAETAALRFDRDLERMEREGPTATAAAWIAIWLADPEMLSEEMDEEELTTMVARTLDIKRSSATDLVSAGALSPGKHAAALDIQRALAQYGTSGSIDLAQTVEPCSDQSCCEQPKESDSESAKYTCGSCHTTSAKSCSGYSTAMDIYRTLAHARRQMKRYWHSPEERTDAPPDFEGEVYGVSYRSGWVSEKYPESPPAPEQANILLAGGGPSVWIEADLDAGRTVRARLMFSDTSAQSAVCLLADEKILTEVTRTILGG